MRWYDKNESILLNLIRRNLKTISGSKNKKKKLNKLYNSSLKNRLKKRQNMDTILLTFKSSIVMKSNRYWRKWIRMRLHRWLKIWLISSSETINSNPYSGINGWVLYAYLRLIAITDKSRDKYWMFLLFVFI